MVVLPRSPVACLTEPKRDHIKDSFLMALPPPVRPNGWAPAALLFILLQLEAAEVAREHWRSAHRCRPV